ncbi:BlaI/MecI/CopY family transcriptional regulator [Bacillus sp. FJAT-42376]|uniref:BlaI/MecI/CopY family transcriptional regulator n=1 Tax=Bacillus sp. FJAT-42376 TaxID=2014076 RepID=UPI000F4FEACF|nr:BlaI/MecI/CopY family transcriptional regulator [Bacillus sp. FJAT-42376]AZB41603.1 BlaI/MecI/CopY family transcriptional regulator [Bacillus sp. FJAT-42376]
MKINRFKSNESGLNRFFGPLEAKIMEILWSREEMSIKDVQEQLEKEKPISFNTVMTVLKRLQEKEVVVRKIEKRTSYYRPAVTKDHFLQAQSRELTNDLLDEFGPLAVSHMLDALDEADQELIERLEDKLKQLKKDV